MNIVRKYPMHISCYDCKYYLANENTCKRRNNIKVLNPERACHIDFEFKDVTCSVCSKPLRSYLPRFFELESYSKRYIKKMGYDGLELSFRDCYIILCLDCFVKAKRKYGFYTEKEEEDEE